MKAMFQSIVAIVIMACSASASAQFLGDLFFSVPSVSAPSGERVSLTLAAFTGSEAFGASEFALTFDPAQLQLEDASIPSDFVGQVVTDSASDMTTVKVVVADGRPAANARGIVELLTLELSVLGQSGENIAIDAVNAATLLANRAEITGSAFGAEVVVQSVSRAKRGLAEASPGRGDAARTQAVAAQSEFGLRAARLRPAQTPVDIVAADGTYVTVIPATVETGSQ